MNQLAKGQNTHQKKRFCYPTNMIKAEPCLTRYPTNEVGAHPFTLQTLCHGTNGILHSAKCFKMLQSVSKQHFKKGAAISAVIDPASAVEGQRLSARTGVTFQRHERVYFLLTNNSLLHMHSCSV